MESIIGTAILILTGLTTYKAFSDESYYESNIFDVEKILLNKEYKRLFTSGFLHGSWLHYGFNMITLLAFSLSLEMLFGVPQFMIIYLCALIGGNLFALYIHRNHPDYRALGASGAISGIVLSSIVLFPESKISLILIPIEFSSWVFALLFIVISILGIKSQRDNIGHEAHLGGGIVGVLVTIALKPSILMANWWIILLVLIPTIVFLWLIIRNPAFLLVDNYWGFNKASVPSFNISKDKTLTKREKEEQLNELLDKIRDKGMSSLSNKEKKKLEQLKDDI